MRPKKVILLVDADERQLALRRFLIETTGIYRVVSAASSAEAMEIIGRTAAGTPDLLAVEWPGLEGNELVERARAAMPELRTLLFSNTVKTAETFSADLFLPAVGRLFSALLLEQIRVLVTRKRGPKKKPVSSVLAELLAEVRKVS